MRIGDIVAVDVGSGPSVINYVGVVTRSDSWNGIWVTSTRDGGISEQPLGRFAAGGILVDRPDLEQAVEEEPPRSRPSLATTLLVAAGAVVTLFALRGLALRLAP